MTNDITFMFVFGFGNYLLKHSDGRVSPPFHHPHKICTRSALQSRAKLLKISNKAGREGLGLGKAQVLGLRVRNKGKDAVRQGEVVVQRRRDDVVVTGVLMQWTAWE